MLYNKLIFRRKIKKREGEALPILRRFCIEERSIVNNDNTLRSENFSYGMTTNWDDDVREFIDLCEQGILYDDLTGPAHTNMLIL